MFADVHEVNLMLRTNSLSVSIYVSVFFLLSDVSTKKVSIKY